MAGKKNTQVGPLVTRDEARATGQTRYLTGISCKKGHVAYRSVHTGRCSVCESKALRKPTTSVTFLDRSRKKAQMAGLPRYISDNPCRRGHVGERYTSGGGCCKCAVIGLTTRRRARGIFPRVPMSSEARREKRRERLRRYRTNHLIKAKHCAESRAYYWANKEDVAQRVRAAYLKEPWKFIARAAKERAKRANAEGHFTTNDVVVIFERQKGKCANCRISVRRNRHVDHIQPLAKGGTNSPRNLQILCPPCNHRKHAKDPLVWNRENGRLL